MADRRNKPHSGLTKQQNCGFTRKPCALLNDPASSARDCNYDLRGDPVVLVDCSMFPITLYEYLREHADILPPGQDLRLTAMRPWGEAFRGALSLSVCFQ